MKVEHIKGEGRHRDRCHGEEQGLHQRGAKTFRCGRTIAFLER